MPKEYFHDIETKHFFLIAGIFFHGARIVFSYRTKNILVARKKSGDKKKIVLSLHQENISLSSEIISRVVTGTIDNFFKNNLKF